MIPLPHAPTHAYTCQRRKRRAPGMIALGLRDDLMGSKTRPVRSTAKITSPTKLSRDDEENELLKAREILQSFGAEVIGYRSPSWDLSHHTLKLLQGHGFEYSSNLMDDIRPYRHEGKSLIELPVQWMLDDAADFWFDGGS